MHSRTDLLSKLRSAEPALASRDLVPALSCFAFDGKSVTAYNEILAIRVPCPTEFVGGLPGAPLIQFLAACSGKEVELSQTNETVRVACGRAKLDCPWLAPKLFVFKAPPTEGSIPIPVDEDFLLGLQRAMVSMGQDALRAWMLGVSVRVSGKTATFFASNDFSITRAEAKLKGKVAEAKEFILVPSFCSLLLSYAKSDGLKSMAIHGGWLVCEFESGVTLFTREPEEVSVDKLEESFNENNQDADLKPVPKMLGRAIERARILLDVKHDWSTFTVTSGKLRVKTESGAGSSRIVDSMPFPDHADIEIKTGPAILANVLEHASQIGFSSNCVVVEGEGFRSIVAVH